MEFGGGIRRIKQSKQINMKTKTTNKQRILADLKQQKLVKQSKYKFQLRSRVSELRSDGFKIECKTVTNSKGVRSFYYELKNKLK